MERQFGQPVLLRSVHTARGLPAISRSRGRAFFIPRRGRRIERCTLRNAGGAMGRTTGSDRQPGGMVHSFGVGLQRSLRRRAAWIRSLRFLVGGRTFLDVRRPFPGHYSVAKVWDTRFGPRRKSLCQSACAGHLNPIPDLPPAWISPETSYD
jgi:hypothetical protein